MRSPGLEETCGTFFRSKRQDSLLLGLPGSLDKAIDLFPVGAGKTETAAGGHKLAYLLQREMLSMLPGDSHSPAVCPDPTAVFSGSSCIGQLLGSQ